MKDIVKLLAIALMSYAAATASAATVYASGIGPTTSDAAAKAATNWRAAYPTGTYLGIRNCVSASGGATSNTPPFECVAYGDDNQPPAPVKVIVSTSAQDYFPMTACQKATAAWQSQYGSVGGTFTGTSVIEIYGNGGNARPTAFICTASGYILKN